MTTTILTCIILAVSSFTAGALFGMGLMALIEGDTQ